MSFILRTVDCYTAGGAVTSINSTLYRPIYGTVAAMLWGQVYMCCNRKIIVCGLPDTDRQRYIHKFKLLCIDVSSELSGRTANLFHKMESTLANGVSATSLP